jgi:hypothetical protein
MDLGAYLCLTEVTDVQQVVIMLRMPIAFVQGDDNARLQELTGATMAKPRAVSHGARSLG